MSCQHCLLVPFVPLDRLLILVTRSPLGSGPDLARPLLF